MVTPLAGRTDGGASGRVGGYCLIPAVSTPALQNKGKIKMIYIQERSISWRTISWKARDKDHFIRIMAAGLHASNMFYNVFSKAEFGDHIQNNLGYEWDEDFMILDTFEDDVGTDINPNHSCFVHAGTGHDSDYFKSFPYAKDCFEDKFQFYKDVLTRYHGAKVFMGRQAVLTFYNNDQASDSKKCSYSLLRISGIKGNSVTENSEPSLFGAVQEGNKNEKNIQY